MRWLQAEVRELEILEFRDLAIFRETLIKRNHKISKSEIDFSNSGPENKNLEKKLFIIQNGGCIFVAHEFLYAKKQL